MSFTGISRGDAEKRRRLELRDALLHIEHLTTAYTLTSKNLFEKKKVLKAVNDVTFQIFKGETLGVIGESGCGKSTLGKTILHIVKPASGTVSFRDENITAKTTAEMKPFRKKMQIIFQDPYSSLDPRKTAFQLIEEPMIIHRMYNKAARKERVFGLLEDVGLKKEHAFRYPHEFSGGQRQRINVARALALEPEFIVCDEPVSALDVSVQAQVLNLLKNIQQKYHFTYLFISHDLSVVKYLSDRLLIMYLGYIVEEGTARAIYQEPCHPYTKALFASIPPESPFEKKKEAALSGELPSPLNLPAGCPLSTRCPLSRDICREKKPELLAIDEEHRVACHFPEEGKVLWA